MCIYSQPYFINFVVANFQNKYVAHKLKIQFKKGFVFDSNESGMINY